MIYSLLPSLQALEAINLKRLFLSKKLPGYASKRVNLCAWLGNLKQLTCIPRAPEGRGVLVFLGYKCMGGQAHEP